MLSRSVLGVALASAAGVFWGSMSIAAQYLMESVAFDTVDLTALLLTGAGVLLALEAFVLREDVFAPFRDGRDRRDLVSYALGMLGIQLAFFLSIRDANAATAALTVTTGPLFVTGWTAYSEHRAVTKEEWISIALAMAGVSLLVTKSDFSTLDFSPTGVLWGIASAACGAFCTVQPRRMLSRLSIGVVVGWGMALGGAILCIANPPNVAAVEWNFVTTGLYIHIAAVETVAAFRCYLKSLSYISAPTTALLANFEPLTAVVLGVLLLGLTLNAAELIGIALLAVMVFRLTRARRRSDFRIRLRQRMPERVRLPFAATYSSRVACGSFPSRNTDPSVFPLSRN